MQALNEHYHRLLDNPESGVAPPGYSPVKVSHALVLDLDGQLVDILVLADTQGKKSIAKVLLVPEQVKRTSGIAANILCDTAAYVLGIEKNKLGAFIVSKDKFNDFKVKNESFLSDVNSEEARIVIGFLQKWDCDNTLTNRILLSRLEELVNGSNVVFKIDGKIGYVHEESKIREAWNNKLQNIDEKIEEQQCLVTGKMLSIARIHPSIKGVIGSQTSGASIVSFNVDSFISYGKSQSYNAPVSKDAAFAYATALNYLIASDTNRVRLADTTMVFWADKKDGKLEESMLSWWLDPVEMEDDKEIKRRIAPEAARQAKTVLERLKKGLPLGDAEFAPDIRCYMLGLAPNAARLSIRFWQVSSFGDVLTKITQHYKDIEIINLNRFGEFVPPWRILKDLAVQGDSKNIPPLLGGQFLKAVLSGKVYPQSIYNAAISRCRTGGEHGGVTAIRASVVKAVLARKYRIQHNTTKEGLITVGLNENNTNAAYLLGRLFSLLEKAQKDALGSNINATIRDRYFGAASATPGSVFPLLLRLSRHHISKSEYGNLLDRKIQEVVNGLVAFPAHLNMEEQGLFILGYYHQSQANYEKREEQKG